MKGPGGALRGGAGALRMRGCTDVELIHVENELMQEERNRRRLEEKGAEEGGGNGGGATPPTSPVDVNMIGVDRSTSVVLSTSFCFFSVVPVTISGSSWIGGGFTLKAWASLRSSA